MRKLLLSMATLVCSMSAMAADVVFDFVNETYGLTRLSGNTQTYIDNGTVLTENGGVTITLNKTEKKNGWRLWADGLRIYKDSGTSMTLSCAEGISALEFTMAKDNVITGYELGGQSGTLSGKTFTVNCTGGTTVDLGLTVSNNGAIASLKVVTGNGGGQVDPDPDPDPVQTVGDGTQANPYTVADVIALDNNGATSKWVKGVIVGCMNYDKETSTNVFSATELTTGTNIVIAATTTGYETNYVAVQLPSGDVRTALSLVDHPENLGKEVSVCGNLISYCGTWGVKNTSAYSLDGQTTPDPDPVQTVGDGTQANPYTIADVIALNNSGATSKWVKGVIIGCMNYDEAAKANVFSSTQLTTNSNIVIAATSTGYETNYVAVQLPVGDVRTALNLVDHSENLGKEVSVCGDLIKYCGTWGVKNTSAYSLEGQTTPDPDPVETEGKGTEMDPYTIADVIKLNNSGATAQWVNGVIVGVMNYDEAAKANVFSSTQLTTNTNIVIAATASGYETNYVAVQLPVGKIREDLNLVDRPGNLGKEVTVCGDLVKYCGTWGVKNTSAYNIVGGLAPLPVAETASLTSFVEDQCSTNTKILAPVTVFYQSADKKYTFITDGETNLEVYGALTNTYVNGDRLTGIIGKFGYYKEMPQMTPQVDSFGEPASGTPVEPVEKTLASVAPADYVIIKNAKITSVTEENKTTITVSDASGECQLFDRFAIGGIADAENVTILGIGAIFGETKQLFPISITDTPDSISEITAGEVSSEAIYDLQGRRLAAPVRGINIINGRKVLVK